MDEILSVGEQLSNPDAIVFQQTVFTECRDVQIDPAIVVDIATNNSHTVTGHMNAGGYTHVGKLQCPTLTTVISIQT